MITEHLKYLEERLKNPVKGIPLNLPIFQQYYKFIEKEHRILLTADLGNNKLQPYSSLIYTPEGVKTMGEIKKSDYVITKSGLPTKVLDIFPKKNLNIYKITFSDGSFVECCDDHLWEVKNRSNNVYSIKSVKELLNLKYIHKNKNNSIRCEYIVDLCKEVEHTKKELCLDPYLLGYLIGNGSMHKSTVIICSHQNDHDELVNNLVYPKDVILTRSINTSKNGARNRFNAKIIKYLKQLGLHNTYSHNKFIPNNYLFSTIEDRYNLLGGLLDSDGCIFDTGKSCKIRYDSVSELLIDNVRQLVLSLGGACTKRISKNSIGRIYYTLSIRLRKNPCKLERKKAILNKYVNKFNFTKGIRNIEYIGVKDGQCILVEDKNHLYLTDFYTVTHNTQFMTQFFILDPLEFAKNNPSIDVKVYYFSIELSKITMLSRLFNHLIGKEGTIIPVSELGNPSSQETINHIKSLEKFFDSIKDDFFLIDNIHTPKKIYEFMSKEMNKYGKLSKDSNGEYTFTYHNDNQYIFIIVDTINALQADEGSDQTSSIRKWSEVYQKLYLSKLYRTVIVGVQQQDNSVRANSFTNGGLKIEEKHEPSLGSLATVKTTGTDHTHVLSLFKPDRYKITSHAGYPVSLLKDHYIKLNIMKNNFGEMGPDISTHLFCHGNRGYFEEMPKSEDKLILEDFMKDRGVYKFQVNKTINNNLI